MRGLPAEHLYMQMCALAQRHGASIRLDSAEFGRHLASIHQLADSITALSPDGALDRAAAAGGAGALSLPRSALASVGIDPGLSDQALREALFGPQSGCERVLAYLDAEAEAVRASIDSDGEALDLLLDEWLEAARAACDREQLAWRASYGRASGSDSGPRHDLDPTSAEEVAAEAAVRQAAQAVGAPHEWGRYFGRHSKSFRFSARLFPSRPAKLIEGVYAFCRFTDDLVDEATIPVPEARLRLEAWRRLSARAWSGTATGIPLLDEVMGQMARHDVPFHYADDLLTGVGMDLEPVQFKTLDDLHVYTYRVASVVGGWITELFDVRSADLLERAFDMGHAMQLTNIVRDVGEDLRNGRLYVPLALLAEYGIDRADLERSAHAESGLPPGWSALTERLMAEADHHYQEAFRVLPELPVWYARPVAVAARVYQGIHDAVRANGHDNLTRRAHTRLGQKLRLGAGALLALGQLRKERRRRPEWGLASVPSLDPKRAGFDA